MSKKTSITKTQQGNRQITPKGPKVDQVTKFINSVSKAVRTFADGFSAVYDLVEKRDQKYLYDNCSRIPEKRVQLVEDAVSTKELSWEQGEEKLAEIEQEEINERIHLMQTRDNSRRVRAQNAKDWGIAIGCVATGVGFLAKVLYLILWRKKAA